MDAYRRRRSDAETADCAAETFLWRGADPEPITCGATTAADVTGGPDE